MSAELECTTLLHYRASLASLIARRQGNFYNREFTSYMYNKDLAKFTRLLAKLYKTDICGTALCMKDGQILPIKSL